MDITRKSSFTGKTHTRSIDVTSEQLEKWQKGMFIQDAMPHLSADDREFLKTGITPEEWDVMFKKNEEDIEWGVHHEL